MALFSTTDSRKFLAERLNARTSRNLKPNFSVQKVKILQFESVRISFLKASFLQSSQDLSSLSQAKSFSLNPFYARSESTNKPFGPHKASKKSFSVRVFLGDCPKFQVDSFLKNLIGFLKGAF